MISVIGKSVRVLTGMPVLFFAMGPASGAGPFAAEQADLVIVHKERRLLQLVRAGNLLGEYPISLGGNPVGHKESEGDQKTPEGRYILDWRNASSGYYKSIHISYPAPADTKAAMEKGLDPGGMIMIHGQRNYFGWLADLTQMFDWTNGCIAVTNAQMDEIWGLVPDKTPIEIKP